MANSANVVLGAAWVKLTTDSTSEFLASTRSPGTVEFAVTTADAAPTLAEGHVLQAGDGLTRGVCGSGYVWARKMGGYPDQATLVVTK